MMTTPTTPEDRMTETARTACGTCNGTGSAEGTDQNGDGYDRACPDCGTFTLEAWLPMASGGTSDVTPALTATRDQLAAALDDVDLQLFEDMAEGSIPAGEMADAIITALKAEGSRPVATPEGQ